MADTTHTYRVCVTWTGNTGTGTSSPRHYSRAHEIGADGKPDIAGSSDPSFRGDASRWNPEELLVASLASCHKLWYLGLCAEAGITVTSYEDRAEGTMVEHPCGEGQFASVVLRPVVCVLAGSDLDKARALHDVAHQKCFITRSVNFPVHCVPDITIVET